MTGHSGAPGLHPILRVAALNGVEISIRLHVQRGGDVNGCDTQGHTALMLAAQRGHERVCRLLLELGAHDEPINHQGKDALTLAAEQNHTGIVTLLEDHRRRRLPVEPVPADPEPPQDAWDDGLDFSGWEAEPEVAIPAHDATVAAAAVALQASMSRHVVIDREETWDDVAVVAPRARKKHARQRIHDLSPESANALHALLMEGIEHGILRRSQVARLAERIGEEGTVHELGRKVNFDEPGPHEALIHRLILSSLNELDIQVEDFEPWLDEIEAPLSDATDQLAEEVLDVIREQRVIDLAPSAGLFAYTATKRIGREEEVRLAQEMEAAQRRVVEVLVEDPGLLRRIEALVPQLSPSALNRTEALLSAVKVAGRRALTSQEWAAVAAARSVVAMLVRSLSPPFSETESALIGGNRKWMASWERLVTTNLRLVPYKVRRLWQADIPTEDLVQEGCFGIMRAAEMFDCRRGLGFGTYSLHWIRALVSRPVAEGSLIRLPAHIGEARGRVQRAWEDHGPNVLTVADEVRTTPERVELILRSTVWLSSWDEHFEEITELPDVVSPSPEEVFIYQELRAAIEASLARLKPHHAEVMRLRYGLSTGVEQTLEEVGLAVGLTRERVRQIQNTVLEKLQVDPSLRKFFDHPPPAAQEVQA